MASPPPPPQRCDVCHEVGATVGCCTSWCHANYHFQCARRAGAVFLVNKEVYCKEHTSLVGDKVNRIFGAGRAGGGGGGGASLVVDKMKEEGGWPCWSVSALSLWYKRAPKCSYKKCRFTAFLCYPRTAAVLTHVQITLLASFYPTPHAREKLYQAHS